MSTGYLSGLHGRGASVSDQGGAEQSSFRFEDMTQNAATTSGPHQSLAPQNEGLKSLQNDPANLETWDFWHYYLLKFWVVFQHHSKREVVKSIHANPAVLRTYHDSFLFGEVPLSVRVRSGLRAGTFGFFWNLLEFILAGISGFLYVYSTYEPALKHNWAFRVQNVISFAFIADYFLRVYCEPVRLHFIISFWGVVDLLSCIPVILVFKEHITGASLLRLFQFIRLVRIFSFRNKWSYIGSSVAQQITVLSVATFGVIILDAGVLQWVEYHLAAPSVRATCSDQGCITFWESLYLLIVTVSTVGYGDITAKTIVGQVIAVITIVGALTILPIQIGRITALAYRRPYGGSFSSRKIFGSRFLIISGSITFQAVESCLSEFYNPTHSEDLEVYPLRVIVLAPFAPSFELKKILTLYNGLVEFIEGSPVYQSDLERVSADQAAAIFLLADEEAENHQVEDAAQIVRALAIHRFCENSTRIQRKVRIITEVLDPETQRSAIWGEADRKTIEVVCIATVHYRLLARSCIVHGLYTLITNLFTSELQLKYLNDHHFLSEYFHSFDNEIYPVILPRAFDGLEFEEVAELIFNTFSSVLLGLDIQVGHKRDGQPDRHVLLYPKGHKISMDDVGLVIASDLHTAYAISLYVPKEDVESVLHQCWARAKTTATLNLRRRLDKNNIELGELRGSKWKRSNSTVPSGPQVGFHQQNDVFGEEGVNAYQTDGNRKLEYQLRSAIQNVYSTERYPSWGKNDPHALEMGPEEYDETDELHEDSTGPAAQTGHRFAKGTALKKAVEELLAWPPVSFGEIPHPGLIAEKGDDILKDLKERTINIVSFTVPHILVCCHSGWPVQLFYFVKELRKPGRHNPPIVMLYPEEVSSKEWGSVGVFKDLYFIKGSGMYELDLLRAGVLQAEKIVILAYQGVPVDLGGKDGDDNKYLKRTPAAYTSDVENVVVSANVRRLYGKNFPPDGFIVEVKNPDAMFYLRPQYEISRSHFPTESFRRNRKALVHFTPPYMEGKVVASSMLGCLLRALFYNKNTRTIVDQLILGGHVKTSTGVSKDRPRTLILINVPEQYWNRPYCDLFLGLLKEREMLAIGLYRVKGTLGAPTAYVLTNPKQAYIVNPDDRVYVLQ